MLKPLKEDDLNHKPKNDPTWRESYYFGFYDQIHDIGMYTSMGERPYKDHAGAIIGIWGKVGPFVHNFLFDNVNRTDRIHKAQSCIYECLEPLKRWRLTYKGEMPSYEDSSLRIDPSQLTRSAALKRPAVSVEYDLIWEGISPCYKFEPLKDFFDVHLEQHGSVTGWLKIGKDRFDIKATGYRDRSCGPRNWLRINKWTWTPTFFPEPLPLVGLSRTRLRGREDVLRTDGYIFDRNKKKLEEIVESGKEVERIEAEHVGLPVKLKFDVKGREGTRITYTGEVQKIVPVVLAYGGGKKNTMEGLEGTMWIDRCLVKYTLAEDIITYGEVELAETLNYRVMLDSS
jgi:hypothetical protein